jgi:hypothetical protein
MKDAGKHLKVAYFWAESFRLEELEQGKENHSVGLVAHQRSKSVALKKHSWAVFEDVRFTVQEHGSLNLIFDIKRQETKNNIYYETNNSIITYWMQNILW